MLKLFVYIETWLRQKKYLVRGQVLKFYLTLHGCKVGKKLKCRGWPFFRTIPCRNIFIGDYVTIGKYVTLETHSGGIIELDDYVLLSENVLISSHSSVSFGKWSGAGEFSSIRDADHGSAAGINIRNQKNLAEPIKIGNDVQISRGCTILKGSIIEDGAIIGANTTVWKGIKIEKNGIYFGNPAKLISERT
jgi:acetyltransferase-like isoleucine patch superfamily enzyme